MQVRMLLISLVTTGELYGLQIRRTIGKSISERLQRYSISITYADSCLGVRLSAAFVCLSAFPHDVSKTAAARITKHAVEMSQNESWKPTDFGVEDQTVINCENMPKKLCLKFSLSVAVEFNRVLNSTSLNPLH